MRNKPLLCMLLFVCSWDHGVFADENDSQPILSQCGEMDCVFGDTMTCKKKCGCDQSIPYSYNTTTGHCVLNLKTLILSLAEKYKTYEKNRKRTESIFQGVMISGIIVVTWASVCLFSACFYCCRIKYTDHQLRKSVKEMANNLRAHPKAIKNKQRFVQREELESSKPVREETSFV